jgi:Flp pilus assembly protein TadG
MRSARRRGATAIEFALWMPVMLLMFAGIVDVSLYLNGMHQVVRAARDGARVTASTTLANVADPSSSTSIDSELQTVCYNHALNVLNDSGRTCGTGCTITCSWFTDNTTATSSMFSRPEVIAATVKVPYTSVFNLLPVLGSQKMTSTFTMITQIQVADTVP